MESGPFMLESGDACDQSDSYCCHPASAPGQCVLCSEPHYPPCRSLQMGAIATFLGVIVFFHGDFSVPGACTGRLPLEPPKKDSGRGG